VRANYVFLTAVLPCILITSMLAQAPKSAATTAPKVAISSPPRPAGASGAPRPRPAGSSGARTAVKTVPKVVPQKEMTDEEKTIYALGLGMSRSLRPFALSTTELDLIKRALTDADAGKPAIVLDEWAPRIQGLAGTRAILVTQREKEASAAYLASAALEPGAIKTASGLIYKELTPGTGVSPVASDTVKVHYRGTLIDGTEFDSSYKRNEPTQFPLSSVIRGWTEGVQLMKVGGKSRLICPSDLAYGDQGRPSIPGGAALIFEIELLEVSGK
jgi:FKBP-type peptidyl-prolyl cis-trans isomerase FkpA